MAIQATIKINNSLKGKIEQAEKLAEEAVKRKLEAIATDVVRFSPVDTGAYVTSHSFKSNTSSRGRGKTSDNKPRGQSGSAKRQEGLSNLLSDIEALDLEGMQKITLRNDSSHAQIVERGQANWTPRDSSVADFDPSAGGYFVYAKIRNIHGR